jgi:hypothetical protein
MAVALLAKLLDPMLEPPCGIDRSGVDHGIVAVELADGCSKLSCLLPGAFIAAPDGGSRRHSRRGMVPQFRRRRNASAVRNSRGGLGRYAQRHPRAWAQLRKTLEAGRG